MSSKPEDGLPLVADCITSAAKAGSHFDFCRTPEGVTLQSKRLECVS